MARSAKTELEWWVNHLNMRTVRPPEETAFADPRIRNRRRMRTNDHRSSNDLRWPLPLPRKIRSVLPYNSPENRRCFNRQLGVAARSCTRLLSCALNSRDHSISTLPLHLCSNAVTPSPAPKASQPLSTYARSIQPQFALPAMAQNLALYLPFVDAAFHYRLCTHSGTAERMSRPSCIAIDRGSRVLSTWQRLGTGSLRDYELYCRSLRGSNSHVTGPARFRLFHAVSLASPARCQQPNCDTRRTSRAQHLR
jgi:hypothetical protein